MIAQKNIRNFSIIAHIDHGKSTLSDRLIQNTGRISEREMKDQILDSMDLERERGITIKAQTVQLQYVDGNGDVYILNLIDTPGHVDFGYEVSRSMFAVEGSILVVDSTQGVEAQTLANVHMSLDANHEIIIALNKTDLPSSEPDRVCKQIEEIIGLETDEALMVSAKTGKGIAELLEAIVLKLPPPSGNEEAPLRALLVDSWYDAYIGVVIMLRIVDGKVRKGMKIKMLATDATYTVDRLGYFTPRMVDSEILDTGMIGFITGSIRQVSDTKVGDTITEDKMPCDAALPGFKPSQPVVFCGLFPVDNSLFNDLRAAISKLQLNDSSFTFEIENSTALGFGFRCGFLGMLHMDIIQERLEREYNFDLIITAPSVVYRVINQNNTVSDIYNPLDLPENMSGYRIQEPWIAATIMIPEEYIGDVLALCQGKRGVQTGMSFSGKCAVLEYRLPLNEIVFDFYDKLKSVSKGYASFDYQLAGYEDGDLLRISILINEEPIDALCMVVHRETAEKRGRALCEKLKTLIPRHMFRIPIQAAAGGRIIARETISAMRKDVTAKCYGGDVSRKRKLLDKQKEGKRRMRQFGSVSIPQNAFIQALKLD